MNEIKVGATARADAIVDKTMLAVNVGSGSLEVFATPMLSMIIEKAACKCISEFMENDETTVGTELNLHHTAATPEGMKVWAEVEVTEVNGREIVFKATAYDDCGIIGDAIHKRFIVFGQRFTEKAKTKLK